MSSPKNPHSALKFQPPGAFAKQVNRAAHAALTGLPRFGDTAQAARTAAFDANTTEEAVRAPAKAPNIGR